MGLKLSSAEEKKFQEWMNSNPRVLQWRKEFIREYGEEPNIDNSNYDYRKAWKNGVVPEPDQYDNNRLHWSSSTQSGEMLKADDHPTAWKEYFMRETGKNPDAIGVKTKEQAEKILKKKLQDRPLMNDSKIEE